MLRSRLSTFDVVQIYLGRVELTQYISICPDSVLPIELQVMGIERSVDSNKLIRFRIVESQLHSVIACQQGFGGDFKLRRVICFRGDGARRPFWIVGRAGGANRFR